MSTLLKFYNTMTKLLNYYIKLIRIKKYLFLILW